VEDSYIVPGNFAQTVDGCACRRFVRIAFRGNHNRSGAAGATVNRSLPSIWVS
jgi:hypothetical protein